MLLKPLNENLTPSPNLGAISSVLRSVGIVREEEEVGQVKNIFNENGCSLYDAAYAVGSSLKDDKLKLKAAELVLKAHGALKESERNSAPVIQVNIVCPPGREKNLLELVVPRA